MAVYYFSKAVKFLEKSNDKNLNIAKKINANEYIGNLSTQKTHEIVFNYGLAFFKSGKFYEAFQCFEKVSQGVISQNPKLWYYMSLSALNLNKKLYSLSEETRPESEIYHSKLGYQIPQYVKQVENQKHKRFLLAPKGDPV